MTREVVELFRPLRSGLIVDATFGGGGHSRALLEDLPTAVRILGLDRDPEALAGAQIPESERLRVVRANFAEMEGVLSTEGVNRVAGFLFDLGVSSRQLEDPARGFSFRFSGPLDMRMGPDAPLTANEVVNQWPEAQLAEVIEAYSEERYARRIARAIVSARPIVDTVSLAEVIKRAIPAAARRTGPHPARRTFQALRIIVNDELEAFSGGLEAALDRLTASGRCVVISYHSGEDRIAKRRFARGTAGCICPADFPVCVCGESEELVLLTRRPLRPSAQEVAANPRARSARLRAVEKVA